MNNKESKRNRKPSMAGTTKRNYEKKKDYYDYMDITREIIKRKNINEEAENYYEEQERIRKIVTYSCKSLGKYWGFEPLVEYIQGELFLDKIVSLILEILDDSEIKKILNRINTNKSVSREQVKKIKELSIKILVKGKSLEEEEKVKEKYRLKEDSIVNILNSHKQMQENFRELYNRYVGEILKEQRHTIDKNLQSLVDTNQEILQLVNQKINEILYKNKIYQLEIEFAEKTVFNCEEVNVNLLMEKIREIGTLYNMEYTKDIQRIASSLKYIK